MHTAMAHLRSCRWFKLKPISRRTRVAYFCQGEYIRRIIVARNQIEVARHEKWIMNSTLRTPHTYIHTQHAMPARHMVWSFGLEQLKRRRFFPCLNTGSYISGFASKIQSQNDCETSNSKKGQLDFYETLRHTWNYLKVKVYCCGPAKHFSNVSNSFSSISCIVSSKSSLYRS